MRANDINDINDTPSTPFDALAEEKAQRPTQPLPSNLAAPRTRGGKLPVPTGELNDYGDLPGDEGDAVAPVANLSTPAATGPLFSIRRLRQTPTEILVGLSVVGGALLVVVVSLAMNALVPKPPVNQDGMVGDIGPQVAVIPPETLEGDDGVKVEIAPPEDAATVAAERDEESSAGSEEGESESRARDEERDRDSDRNRDSDRDSDRDTDRSSRSERERVSEDGDKSFTHSEKGYRITLPEGFSLRDEGRRTVWEGPDDSQLLVETVSSPDGSPREGWERLDKSLARKYGSRYRNLGIRETTLAGRPAAIWEFELTEKDGKKVRKIDVGVHHGDTGYAVLGAAPAKKFDELRPQLERAIRSLQLPEKTSRGESESTQSARERDTRESDPKAEEKTETEVFGY